MSKKLILNLILVAVLFQVLIFLWADWQKSRRNTEELISRFSVAIFPLPVQPVEVLAERIQRLNIVKNVGKFSAQDVLEKVKKHPTLSRLHLPEENPFQPYVSVELGDFTVADLDLVFKNIPGVDSVKYDRQLYDLIRDFQRQSTNLKKQFFLVVIFLVFGVVWRFVFLPVSAEYLTELIYRLVVVLVIFLVNKFLFQMLIFNFAQFLMIFASGLLVCSVIY